MRYIPVLRHRVLAIDPHPGGFGYSVLEDDPFQLVDWGISTCRRQTAHSCLDAIERLIDQYRPTLLVLEDWSHCAEHRRIALAEFVRRIGDIFVNGIAIRCYTRTAVREAFAETGALSKYQIAQALVAIFPELEPRLPRRRYAWEGEDRRMSIFDATALAMTHFGAQ